MNIATPRGLVSTRPETPADAEFRVDLFAQSRTDLAVLPPDVRAALLPMQFRAQTLGYQSQFPDAQNEIIELDGRPIGRVMCDWSADMLYLVDIALLSSERNHGLGDAILRALMDSARAAGLGMRLRVANGNPAARRFYARLGFGVVEQNPSDAVMEWHIPAMRA